MTFSTQTTLGEGTSVHGVTGVRANEQEVFDLTAAPPNFRIQSDLTSGCEFIISTITVGCRCQSLLFDSSDPEMFSVNHINRSLIDSWLKIVL